MDTQCSSLAQHNAARVLFVCTGNYYRSRFAEAFFNHLATKNALPWKAFSRGLATWHIKPWDGTISPHTEREMDRLGVDAAMTAPLPVQVAEEDFASATRVIALDEEEHRPMMIKQFPAWADMIEYWRIADLHALDPRECLDRIQAAVLTLHSALVEKK